jgi:hypothetical protein
MHKARIAYVGVHERAVGESGQPLQMRQPDVIDAQKCRSSAPDSQGRATSLTAAMRRRPLMVLNPILNLHSLGLPALVTT